MRYVSNGAVITLGEGHDWSQAPFMTIGPEIGNWYIWKRQMQRFVEECKCSK